MNDAIESYDVHLHRSNAAFGLFISRNFIIMMTTNFDFVWMIFDALSELKNEMDSKC